MRLSVRRVLAGLGVGSVVSVFTGLFGVGTEAYMRSRGVIPGHSFDVVALVVVTVCCLVGGVFVASLEGDVGEKEG